MRPPEERPARTPRPALYAYALSLPPSAPAAAALPEDPPLPRGARAVGPTLRGAPAFAAVRDALTPLLRAPDSPATAEETAHRLAELPVRLSAMVRVARTMPLPDEPAARAFARRLVRTGTARHPVCVGLALLGRLGEAEDIPSLLALARLELLSGLALTALEPLDPATAALARLDGRIPASHALRPLVDASLAGAADDALALLAAPSFDADAVFPEAARWIADALGLAELARHEPPDPPLLARAALLLVRMARSHDHESEILRYGEARQLCEAVVRHAHVLPPTDDHAAVLLSLAVELHSGPLAVLPWRHGQRERLLVTLGAVLEAATWSGVFDGPGATATPQARHRSAWFDYTVERVFRAPVPPGRFRVEVLSGDPADLGCAVQVRVLVDGRPLVPAALGGAAGAPPEQVLLNGALRATGEPHEAVLGETWCSSGCCGTLRATVVREGGAVVWRDWRRPSPLVGRPAPPELPAHRFDAAAYDAEVARATADDRWSWPARRTAWLLGEALRARPGLAARWDCEVRLVGTDGRQPHTTTVHLVYRPGVFEGTAAESGPWLMFRWRLPDDGTEPGERVAAALRRIGREDPRGFAECVGGAR
ncbi:hypothetical protein [Streptomyces sp. NPDC090025]|uniref:hypothetical protein n=1 Tax=Streptomyces sp. NPDC090025 TaxID=3365922 RepID=UPI0038336D93